MSDPSLALQGAVVAALKGNATLTALVGQRIYDSVPPAPVFPYVSLGDGQVLGDDTEDCGDGSEIHLQIDAWSRAVGYPEVKNIAEAIRSTLKVIPTLAGFTVSVVEFVQKQDLRDTDGLTRHAAITFRYLITHTS